MQSQIQKPKQTENIQLNQNNTLTTTTTTTIPMLQTNQIISQSNTDIIASINQQPQTQQTITPPAATVDILMKDNKKRENEMNDSESSEISKNSVDHRENGHKKYDKYKNNKYNPKNKYKQHNMYQYGQYYHPSMYGTTTHTHSMVDNYNTPFNKIKANDAKMRYFKMTKEGQIHTLLQKTGIQWFKNLAHFIPKLYADYQTPLRFQGTASYAYKTLHTNTYGIVCLCVFFLLFFFAFCHCKRCTVSSTNLAQKKTFFSNLTQLNQKKNGRCKKTKKGSKSKSKNEK